MLQGERIRILEENKKKTVRTRKFKLSKATSKDKNIK